MTKANPMYVQFYISKNCHLKCAMCNIVEANKTVTEVSLGDIKKIADNLSKIGTGVVLLTGGEPFLRKDIADIVKIFLDRSIEVRLQTAGLYQRFDSILQCARLGANNINISLDTLNENLADEINGVQGSWKNALLTIARICREFPPEGALCALGCVLSPYNMDHVESVLDFAEEIGWWLSLVPVHIDKTHSSQYLFRGRNHRFAFQESDYTKLENLINRLKIRKREGANIFDSDVYLNSISSFVRTGRPSWRKNDICDSPGLYFAIEPNGKFAPCCDYRIDEEIYVQDDDFIKQYNNVNLREKIRDIVKTCPGCNFGSYPEISLSVRSLSTLWERMRLMSKVRLNHMRNISDEAIFDLAANLRDKYSY